MIEKAPSERKQITSSMYPHSEENPGERKKICMYAYELNNTCPGGQATYHFLLLLGVGVDASSVLGAPVASLSVNLGGVDTTEEDTAELLEAHLGRVVVHLGR